MRLALVFAVMTACASSPQKKDQELMTDVREFQEGLRWRKYDEAAHHVHAAARVRFLDAHDELDGELRIDDYEVMRVTLTGEFEATVRVKYTWHLDSVGRVHESTYDQDWQRQGKVWRVVGTRQRSGEPLPASAMPDDAASATAQQMR